MIMNSEFFYPEKVSQIIQDYCYEFRITEADFAELLGIHPAHLPRIKKGTMGSIDVLAKIAALGKVPLQQLIKDTPDRLKDELIEIGNKKNISVFA